MALSWSVVLKVFCGLKQQETKSENERKSENIAKEITCFLFACGLRSYDRIATPKERASRELAGCVVRNEVASRMCNSVCDHYHLAAYVDKETSNIFMWQIG